MRFIFYWILVVSMSLLAMVERIIAGYSGTFWAMMFGAIIFWLCCLGDWHEGREGG